jgi:hypothetical protein
MAAFAKSGGGRYDQDQRGARAAAPAQDGEHDRVIQSAALNLCVCRHRGGFGCNFGRNFLVDCSCNFLPVIRSRARLRRSVVR